MNWYYPKIKRAIDKASSKSLIAPLSLYGRTCRIPGKTGRKLPDRSSWLAGVELQPGHFQELCPSFAEPCWCSA
jgi:hypothetical protein